MVSLSKVTKFFKNKPVLAQTDLVLEADKVVAILGPSGAGKTTLLRILAGLIKPDSGEVLTNSQKLAYVFQEPRLLPWRTAIENVAFGLKCNGNLPRREQLRLAQEYLEKIGLGEYSHFYPAKLSGGMRQRVAIARAFILKPDLLLLDEPFSAIDIALKDSLYKILIDLLDWQPTTAVLVTHDPREAVRLADKVVVLSGKPGRISYEINIKEPRKDRGEELLDSYQQELVRRLRNPSSSEPSTYNHLYKQLQHVLIQNP